MCSPEHICFFSGFMESLLELQAPLGGDPLGKLQLSSLVAMKKLKQYIKISVTSFVFGIG